MINNFDDFCVELIKAGFTVASSDNGDGVFSLLKYNWNNEPPDSAIRWHTGEPDTDPWEWRMRVLNERNDIAYSKVFFKKAGYITKEWYPYFLAARRGNKTFEEEYLGGTVSSYAKRIYDAISDKGRLPLHEIKQLAGFSREDKSKFDTALTELQMKLYLTMCGSQQKTSSRGEEYGWSSTVFCTTESFWGEEVFEAAAKVKAPEAADKIAERILALNPSAQQKKIAKFIKG